MVEWHHRLSGHEYEQALGDGEGQGILAFCNQWGHNELDMAEQQQCLLGVLLGSESYTPALFSFIGAW